MRQRDDGTWEAEPRRIVWAIRARTGWVWADGRQPEHRLDEQTGRELDRLVISPDLASRPETPADAVCTDSGGAVLIVRHQGRERGFSFPCGYNADAASRISEIVLAGRITDWQGVPIEHIPPGLPLRRLVENPASGFSGSNSSELLTEVRTNREWQAFWPRLNAGQRALPPPIVDFDREMLLLARMETQPRGGYTVRIDRVLEEPSGLTAIVTFQSPGRTCGGTAALSTPTDIVAVPASDKRVRWEIKRTTKPCS